MQWEEDSRRAIVVFIGQSQDRLLSFGSINFIVSSVGRSGALLLLAPGVTQNGLNRSSWPSHSFEYSKWPPNSTSYFGEWSFVLWTNSRQFINFRPCLGDWATRLAFARPRGSIHLHVFPSEPWEVWPSVYVAHTGKGIDNKSISQSETLHWQWLEWIHFNYVLNKWIKTHALVKEWCMCPFSRWHLCLFCQCFLIHKRYVYIGLYAFCIWTNCARHIWMAVNGGHIIIHGLGWVLSPQYSHNAENCRSAEKEQSPLHFSFLHSDKILRGSKRWLLHKL